MSHNETNPNRPRALRKKVLLGTACAALLGGAVLGESTLWSNQPAYAQPIQPAPVQAAQIPDFATLVERVSPAVVSIRVRGSSEEEETASSSEGPSFDFRGFPEGSPMERFFREFQEQMPNMPGNRGQGNPGARRSVGLGSGFFISNDGYVVTNNHVVESGSEFTVTAQDSTEYQAKLIGKDEKTDLALLKVEADEELPYVKLSADGARVGEWVLAVGNPFGLGGTVTAGIVSASGRQIGAGPYDDFIQIDAAVNRGNSGGPTFNLKGEVIGINSAIFSPSGGNVGIAFAIPATTAQHIIDGLKENGSIVRGWLGVQIQPVTEPIAQSLGLEKAAGALVAEPLEDSPAGAAGIQAGDAITAVDGKPIEDARDLAMRVADMRPGDFVDVTVWRDGKEQQIAVKLGTMPTEDQQASTGASPSPQVEPSSLEGLGLSLMPGQNGEGVTVSEVNPDGVAAESGLQPGDTILSVGNAAVKAPSDVEKAVETARADGRKAVLFRVQSGETTRFVALTFEKA